MIHMQNISMVYGKGEATVHALQDVSLEICAGEFLGVQGTSGSGKSTLLNVMGAILRPTEGKYILEGQDVFTLSNTDITKYRANYFGYITQSFSLIEELSVQDNVALPLMYSKHRKADKMAMVHDALAKMGIETKSRAYPSQLSGGQQQRVAIARAIVNAPKLILADEPTGALDSKTGYEVMEVLKQIHEQGQTIVMVTHDEQYLKYFSRTIQLSDGKIIG